MKHPRLLLAKSLWKAKKEETNLESKIADRLLVILTKESGISPITFIFTDIEDEVKEHLDNLVLKRLQIVKQKTLLPLENVSLDVFVSKVKNLISDIRKLSQLGGGDALDALEEKVNTLKETVSKIASYLPMAISKENIVSAISDIVNLIQKWSGIQHLDDKVNTLLGDILPKVEELLRQIELNGETEQREDTADTASDEEVTLWAAADEIY